VHAVKADQALAAPTVGTWSPAIGVGAPLAGGLVLGTLRRAGRAVPVLAPEGVAGVASRVAPAGTWVEHGARLVTIGEALAVGADAEAHAEAGDRAVPPGVTVLTADSDGTIYLRPDPGSPPFAPVGAPVAARSTLALVEVMKTFTPVRSPIAGTVEQVLVDDGGAVSAGQPLLWIRAGS